MAVKLNTEVIAQAALGLLDDEGLDGLTMRKVAGALDVQAPALYWHVKNKRELLDVMAQTIFVAAVQDLEVPHRGETWQAWLLALAQRLRDSMVQYRDGAKVLAGTFVSGTPMWRTIELALRTLEDADLDLEVAERVFPLLMNYAVGFVIEEQARTGVEYQGSNPYDPDEGAQVVDPKRYPRTAAMVGRLLVADFDAEFAQGVEIILAGVAAAGIER